MSSKYKKIKLGDGKTIDEHRLVFQKHIGRQLSFNEVVHHKDGDGYNNKIENLELRTRSAHSREHIIGIKRSKETKLKLRDINRREHTPTLSFCCSCKNMKLHSDFPKNKNNWTGLHHYCKRCWKDYQKKRKI